MEENTLSSKHEASQFESIWYEKWESAGLFQQETQSSKPKFTITIPPPNITGALHMGHSLCYPIQDLIARFKKLKGYNVLVVPGQDHAGIATQSVVSKKLRAEGKNPAHMTREEFIGHVWEWRKESGDTIIRQFRTLGCGFDWDRLRFTLDDDYVKAVLSVFINWTDRGLIYRGKRVINWDPALKTSVSDIETLRKVSKGKLYHIKYPYADGSGHLVVATTRPETMLGDVAVAVHPSDARYVGLIGKELVLPLAGRNIPLVADIYPDPNFGTGAVKITPAHDPNDFEVGVRHKLEMPVVIDEDAKICQEGPYFGLDRFAARKKIVEDLEVEGYLEKIEDHEIALIVSDRSGEIIEPLLSEQWFVKQSELADPAIKVVKSGEIQFFPDRYSKVYTDWLENIRDWCISRQLWWGHRVPVFYTEDGEWFAAQTWEEAQAKAGDKKIVRQDEDVLDTWFSSGLWPFATLGWPNETTDLKERYPTSVLVTDRNIIYLWVARMAMMGLDFVQEKPFKHVYIHATVLTEDGKRMSKSLGTGIDPTEIIEKVGADSLRYTLLSQAGTNQELRYSERRTEDSKRLCNKIWNAARFVQVSTEGIVAKRPEKLEIIDAWILGRLARMEFIVNESYEKYDIMAASNALYAYFWGELCDWYLEICKSRMSDPVQGPACKWVLLECLKSFLIMLHPIMPFITEEVYSKMPFDNKADFIVKDVWPSHVQEFASSKEEAIVENWIDRVRAMRALRSDLEIDPRKPLEIAYYEGDLQGGDDILVSQAWLSSLVNGKPESGKYVSTTSRGVTLHIPTASVDIDKLLTKANKEIESVIKELEPVQKRLTDPMFVERAKPEVVEKMREQVAGLLDKQAKTLAMIATLKS